MSTMTNPLYIRFDNNTARIWCNDLALRQSLARYFRHSLGEETSVVVTYQFTNTPDDWQLRRNDLLLFVEPSRLRIIGRFLQDVTIMFIKHVQARLLLHAAGVASGHQGIILCGQSGRGKSTLAAWLIASGFDFLTDELIAIRPDSSEMCGFTRPVVLKKGSDFVWQRWLGVQEQNSLTRFSDNTVWLDPEDLRPGCVRKTSSPHILLYPRYSAGNSLDVRSLSAAESAFRLMQHLVNVDHLPDGGFTAIVHLAQNTTACSVTYGDVTQAATWLQQFVILRPAEVYKKDKTGLEFPRFSGQPD